MKYLMTNEWFFNKSKKLDWLRDLSSKDFTGWEFDKFAIDDDTYYFEKEHISVKITPKYSSISFDDTDEGDIRYVDTTIILDTKFDRKFVDKLLETAIKLRTHFDKTLQLYKYDIEYPRIKIAEVYQVLSPDEIMKQSLEEINKIIDIVNKLYDENDYLWTGEDMGLL